MKPKLALVSILPCLLPSLLSAQGPSTDQPQTTEHLTQSATSALKKSSTTKPIVTSSQQILVPSLNGLSIASNDTSSLAGQSAQMHAVRIVDFDTVTQEKIHHAAAPYLGKPVSRLSLKQLSDAIESALHTPQRPLLIARFPAQEITSGVLAITIAPAQIEQIRVKGKWVFGKKFSLSSIKSRKKSLANAETIRKDVAWLNQNPFRQATASWENSAEKVNAATLIFSMAEKRPWNVNIGIDNYASRRLGDERLFLGGRLGNLFDLDHRLSWSLMHSTDGDQLRAWFLNYQIPLPEQILLNVAVSQSESDTVSANDVENNGRFFNLRTGVEWQLPDLGSIHQQLTHELSWRDNNYHLQKNASHRDFPVRLFQLSNTWEASREDQLGLSRLSVEATLNPGSSFLSSSANSFRALGGEDSRYWFAQANLERSFRLGVAGSLHLRGEYRWSDEHLIGADQSYITGISKVRGYDESLINGDKTLFLSTEWSYPVQHLWQQQWLQPLLFVDYASFSDTGRTDGSDIAAAGIGLRWKWTQRMQGRVDFGVPLRELAGEETPPMLQFSVSSTW